MNNYLGIDLGTTNSVASTVNMQNNKINTPIIKINRITGIGRNGFQYEKKEILPSYYSEKKVDNENIVIIGDYAKEIHQTQPYNAVKSVKSQMGRKFLQENPDKTPESVSAEILKHIKLGVEKELYSNESEVVIAVPASFDPIQRHATLRSAEMAGFNVRDQKGEYREDILISEPEAVLYNVINQVQKGEIHIDVDFTTNKKILVFDIGGGTLDVTIHDVVRNKEIPEIFDVKPIAISRYSQIAGDTFDNEVAKVLLNRYSEEFKEFDENLYKQIISQKELYMANMETYAEDLKFSINSKNYIQTSRGIEFNRQEEVEYGGSMSNGYSSEETIKISEYEEILSSLLGKNFVFDDYKKFNNIDDKQNIIYPVLDVLSEASKTLGDVKIDAVILNGGMSKFYLIEERISEFFGINAIKVSDPDKSVAQGASVYHYYLKNSNLKNLETFTSEPKKKFDFVDVTEEKIAGIRTTSNILGDNIYLGLRGENVHLLAQRGQELPYISEKVHSFEILAGQTKVQLPLKSFDGKAYKTIAVASVDIDKKMTEEKMDIMLNISRSQIITLELFQNQKRVAKMALQLGEQQTIQKLGSRVISTDGMRVNAKSEVINLVKKAEAQNNNNNAKQITQIINSLKNCLNPQDFADEIVSKLNSTKNEVVKGTLLRLAKELAPKWTDAQKLQLESSCLYILNRLNTGVELKGMAIQTTTIAITVLKYGKTKKTLETLDNLCKNPKLRTPLLHTLGHLGHNENFIYNCFIDDYDSGKVMHETLKAITLCLYNNEKTQINLKEVFEVSKNLIQSTGDTHEFNLAILALGISGNRLDLKEEVLEVFSEIKKYKDQEGIKIAISSENSRNIISNLLSGQKLEEVEEEYLLSVLS